MTKAARYTVLIDRELGESDGSGVYHDGTGKAAVEQVVKELQELWNEAGGTGFFEIIERRIVTWPSDMKSLFDHVPHYEDEHDGDPSPADYAGRLRHLGNLLADIKEEFGTGEVAISLDNALDDINGAIRTLESGMPNDSTATPTTYEDARGYTWEAPDDEGRIRVRDFDGNVAMWLDPGDDGYDEALAPFSKH